MSKQVFKVIQTTVEEHDFVVYADDVDQAVQFVKEGALNMMIDKSIQTSYSISPMEVVDVESELKPINAEMIPNAINAFDIFLEETKLYPARKGLGQMYHRYEENITYDDFISILHKTVEEMQKRDKESSDA